MRTPMDCLFQLTLTFMNSEENVQMESVLNLMKEQISLGIMSAGKEIRGSRV